MEHDFLSRTWSPLHKQKRDSRGPAGTKERLDTGMRFLGPVKKRRPLPLRKGSGSCVRVPGAPPLMVNGGSASTWGFCRLVMDVVEKTADEHGLLRGVEQSTIRADGEAIIGLMHGPSTNGSSRAMLQQTTGKEHQSCQGPRLGNAY